MRIVSSIFSWIGGVVTIIVGFVRLSIGHEVDDIYYIDGLYPVKTGATKIVPYDTWVWVLWFIYLGGMLAVLILREISVRRGSKVLFGVLTLIFASLVGGILTLCIPDSELFEHSYKHKRIDYHKIYAGLNTAENMSQAKDTSDEKEEDESTIEDIKKYEESFDPNFAANEEYKINQRDFGDEDENKYRYK